MQFTERIVSQKRTSSVPGGEKDLATAIVSTTRVPRKPVALNVEPDGVCISRCPVVGRADCKRRLGIGALRTSFAKHLLP